MLISDLIPDKCLFLFLNCILVFIIFVNCVRLDSFFAWGCPVVPAPFVEKPIFAPFTCIFTLSFSKDTPAWSPPRPPNTPLIHGTIPVGRGPLERDLGPDRQSPDWGGPFNQASAQGQGRGRPAGPGDRFGGRWFSVQGS